MIITVYNDGKIVGCEVAHQAHEKGTFSSIGKIVTSDFKMADGTIQAKIATEGEQKTFGQTWEVKIQFKAKAP